MDHKPISNLQDRSSIFKALNGNLLFKPLILEFSRDEDRDRVLYTLKDEDVSPTIRSLKRLYMEQDDISEYTFATLYFYNFDHWERLTHLYWFTPFITKWRRELEVKIRSKALSKLVEISKGDSNQAAAVNKYLLEGKWKDKQGNIKPKKFATSKKELDSSLELPTGIDKDYDRLISSLSSSKGN